MENHWHKIKGTHYIGAYQLLDEPIVIHIIKTGEKFAEKYFVLHEDGWDLDSGQTEILTKSQIFDKFGIEL